MPSSASRRPRLAVLLGAVGTAALAVAAARAEPAPPYPALLVQAQVSAPRLVEGGAEVRRAEGLALQAEARPNPTASLTLEGFAGSGPYSSLGGAETTLSVGQPIELGGKRPARIAASRAEIDAVRARQVDARAAFAADLALAYAEAEAAERRQVLAREALALAEEDARTATVLVEAGREAEVRKLQADAAVAAARADIDGAGAETTGALARLAALAGATAPYTGLSGSVLTTAAPPQDAGGVAATPAILAAEAAREAAVRRTRLERARAAPDVTVSVGVRRYGLEDATALVAGVSAPLPLFDRNRGSLAAANAEVQAAEARLAAARLDAQASLAAGRSMATASEARAQAARAGETAADEAYRLTRIGYDAGKTPLIELTAARRALGEARTRTLDAQLARVRAEAMLARLQGRAPFGDRLP